MQSLDVLRGIAIFMVLVVHAPWPTWFMEGPIGRIVAAGAYGVDLFFVLSGYLISRLLFAEIKRTGSIQVGRFWLRRGFKIWPAYYVTYLLSAIVIRQSGQYEWGNLLAWPNFVFLQNYVHVDLRWFASWSLAVEEHFYTTLPLILLGLLWLFKSFKRLPVVLAIFCCLAPVLRGLEPNRSLIWIQTHLRMDALCWGVLLGYAESEGVRWPFQCFKQHFGKCLALIATTALVVLIYPYQHRIGHCAGFTLVAICSTILTGHAVGNPNWSEGKPKPVRLTLNTLSRVGVYSYTIYLCQQLTKATIEILKHWGPTSSVMNSHVPQVFVFIMGSVAIGWVLAMLVERPFLVLREKLVGRRTVEYAPQSDPATLASR